VKDSLDVDDFILLMSGAHMVKKYGGYGYEFIEDSDDIAKHVPTVDYPYPYKTQPLDVDRPMFDLFGEEYDSETHTSTQCAVCEQLVGYREFTFWHKHFYHVQCFHEQFFMKGKL
jgi:hypothetical protein